MSYNNIEVEVHVNGKPTKQFIHENKIFIQANKGSEYTVKVKNQRYSGRILAVVSVDGVNVVSGELAGKNTAGYVIRPRENYEIKGWRTSNDSVNSFKFSDKSKSYAAKALEIKSETNCGIIAVEIYEEKVKEPVYYNPRTIKGYSSTTLDCASFSAESPVSELRACYSVNNAFDTGTEFSDKVVNDSVTDTTFDIGNLIETINIFYASRDGLTTIGVPLNKEPKVVFPTGFPAKFCKPPE